MANNGEKVLYFLIGGFVGAAVALLFAPKSGEETRRILGDKYRAGTDEVQKRVKHGREYVAGVRQDLTDRVSSTIERGRETVGRHKEQLSSAIEAGKKAYYEEKGRLDEAPAGSEESV